MKTRSIMAGCGWKFMSNSLISNLAPLNLIKVCSCERVLVRSLALFVCGCGGANHLMHIINFIASKIHDSPKFQKKNRGNDDALRLPAISLYSVRINLLAKLTNTFTRSSSMFDAELI